METVFVWMVTWVAWGSWVLGWAIWHHPSDPRWLEFDEAGWLYALPVAVTESACWPLLIPLLRRARKGRHR